MLIITSDRHCTLGSSTERITGDSYGTKENKPDYWLGRST